MSDTVDVGPWLHGESVVGGVYKSVTADGALRFTVRGDQEALDRLLKIRTREPLPAVAATGGG